MKRIMRQTCWTAALWVLMLATGGRAATVPADQAVQVTTAWSANGVHPGGTIALAVVLDIAPPYHVNPHKPDADYLIPTVVKVADHAMIATGEAQYPAGHVVTLDYGAGSQKLTAYEGKAVVYIPMIAKPQAAEGEQTIAVNVSWQACDEHTCYPPEKRELRVTLPVVGTGETVTPMNAALFAGLDAAGFAMVGGSASAKPQAASPSGGAEFSFFGSSFTVNTSGVFGAGMVLLLALVAGFFLNFTPCVLPVVPIKVMSLQKHAGDHARSLALGLTFSLGIVACFAALGLLAAGLSLQWGQLFSYAWFSVGLGVILLVMGLGMWGLFTTSLPQWVYQITPRNDTLSGSFGFGVLTAVLSTPCTGPLFAGALVWALKQPAWLSLSVFIAMGVGMALPYLILTAKPRWIDKLPRTGPGSELIKQVMGLLLIAVAIYFIGYAGKPWWGDAHWYAVSAVVIGAMVYMMVCVVRITKRTMPRLMTGVMALLIGAGMVVIAGAALAKPLWTPYSPELFEQARQAGRIVVVEFTADWCFNCKTLEVTVLDKPRVIERLSGKDVTALRVDLTSSGNARGWALLRDMGSTGVPLTAIYRPGNDEPIKLTSFYTVNALLDAMDGRR
ncbi:MAG: protein-disulfide reductase DsbD family protein [Phycisphaerales bacterium]